MRTASIFTRRSSTKRKSNMPQAEWDALLTEGTDSHARWIRQVDVIAALLTQLHERFVSVHHLDNLIWVWNTNASRADAAAAEGFYPGHDVVDFLAADVYANAYRRSHHDDLVELAGRSPWLRSAFCPLRRLWRTSAAARRRHAGFLVSTANKLC